MLKRNFYLERIAEIDRLIPILTDGGTASQLEYYQLLLKRKEEFKKGYLEAIKNDPPPEESWRTIWSKRNGL